MQELLEGLREGVQAMSGWEAIAVLFGLLSVWYSKKNHILVFPTGMISTLIYVWLCFPVKLYADMGINAYYFIMSIYGWYMWSRSGDQAEVLPITTNTKKEHWMSFYLGAGSFVVLAFVLKYFTDSDVPLWDATTTSLAFVGMWLMARRKLENWVAWIITDIISVPLYFYKGMPLTSFQFLVFTILAIWGYISWKKIIKQREQQVHAYAE
jgi:nicotinamide mononucleotide transporter